MTDWKVQIVKIENKVKHSNADTLSVYTVLGDYPIVDKTSAFEIGDLATYIGIDSVMPDTEQYHWLTPKSYEKYEEDGQIKQRISGFKYPVGSVPESKRVIKAKKFFGVYSQGLLMNRVIGFNEGESVSEALNITKLQEEEEDNIPNAKKSKGANAASPPTNFSIPYYDIESIRKYIDCLLPGEEVVLTEKIHGSNAAFCHDGERFWVRSRNYYKKMDPDDPWWDIAIRYDLENKLAKYPNMVFFGELYGTIKGFRYDCEIINSAMNSKIRFFDIWDAKQMRYMDYDNRIKIILDAGLEPVPELYRGTFTNKADIYSYAEGMSTLNPKHVREGFVLNLVKERYEPRLDGRLQFKLVGENYNLQK